MKRPTRRGFAKIAGIIALAGVAGLAIDRMWDARMARQEQLEIEGRYQRKLARLTGKMRTICIGRFLIDLPEEARVTLREMRIDGFDILTFDEPDADFRARLIQREARLRDTPDRLGGKNNLESVREIRTENGVVGKIFVHGRTVTEGTQARGLELERYRYEGIAVEALVHADGMSFEIGANEYDPDLIENLPRLLAKLVPNRGDLPPTGPGYCVYHAWFRDPLTADQNERLMMTAEFPTHPDIDFRLDVMAGATPQGPGLLARIAEGYTSRSYAEKHGLFRLRAAPRTIAGITGEEVVDEFDRLNNVFVQHFRWEVPGTADNVLIPSFTLTMETGHAVGEQVSSSLSQKAAVALWDTISSSIRFHTPGPAKVTPSGPTGIGSGSAPRPPET